MLRIIRITCLFLCITLAYSLCAELYVVNAIDALEESSVNQIDVKGKGFVDDDCKILSEATIDQKFTDNHVIVVLNKSVGSLNKQHDHSLFGSLSLKSIKDLTSLRKITQQDLNSNDDVHLAASLQLNRENFRQILLLELPTHSKQLVLEAIKQLSQMDGIIYAGPNYIISQTATTPNDTSYHKQWNFDNINVENAWDITTGSSEVYVGVIDSGIANHPDLVDNLVEGWDFYHENNSTADDNENGHGTHVAGIIAASGDNSIGIAGVAWNVKLVPLQVTYDNLGYSEMADDIEAITYCIDNNIPIINYSRGGTAFDDFAFKQAFANYQGLVICGAGNRGVDIDIDSNYCYPSSFHLSNVISVANTKQDDSLVVNSDEDNPDPSNYGKKYSAFSCTWILDI